MTNLIVNFRAECQRDVDVLEEELTKEQIDFKIIKNLPDVRFPDVEVELELTDHREAGQFYQTICHLSNTKDCHVIHQTLRLGSIDSETGRREYGRDYSNRWLKDNKLI